MLSVLDRLVDLVMDNFHTCLQLEEIRKGKRRLEEIDNWKENDDDGKEEEKEKTMDAKRSKPDVKGEEIGATANEETKMDEQPLNLVVGHFEQLSKTPMSHKYSTTTKFDQSMVNKSFLTAVYRELKLLRSSLPNGIYVKTYEDRMDLFSCMIIGPQGTLYSDVPFFFDIRLKSDYPATPPEVYVRSVNRQINPNLGEEGNVCLSLLNTWKGERQVPSSLIKFNLSDINKFRLNGF